MIGPSIPFRTSVGSGSSRASHAPNSPASKLSRPIERSSAVRTQCDSVVRTSRTAFASSARATCSRAMSQAVSTAASARTSAPAGAMMRRCCQAALRSVYHRLSFRARTARPSSQARRSSRSSATDWYRRSGSFAIAFITTASSSLPMPGASDEGLVGGKSRIRCTSSPGGASAS